MTINGDAPDGPAGAESKKLTANSLPSTYARQHSLYASDRLGGLGQTDLDIRVIALVAWTRAAFYFRLLLESGGA